MFCSSYFSFFLMLCLFCASCQFHIKQEQKLNTILTAIESTTSRIDTVKRNANISTVAGSTVGVVSGALCITGLALAPVTFGVSTALTIAGAATGAAAAISGITTGITEAVLKSNDICKINDLLNEYKKQISENQEIDSEYVAGDVGTAGVRGVAKGAARVGGIVLSGVFIVVDIYSILSNSIDLSKGSKSRSAAAKKRTASMLRAELTKYRDLYELLQRGRRKTMQLHPCISQN
uniref:Uncharacterized protein n=1 Tax=Erpetoichthys calabaricus TaxID=27687 RepID=A0A8C4SAP7_ERPCA